MITVAAINVAPVKSLGLLQPAAVQVEATGIVEDRRFYLTNHRGELLTQRQAGELVQVRAEYRAAGPQGSEESLTLTFPDGSVIEGRVDAGEAVATRIWGRQVRGRQVRGDWNKMLSKFCGRPVTLVQSRLPGECFDEYPVSILSEASVEMLGRQAGIGAPLDHRRFRPNFLISGCEPHQEDEWAGRQVAFGPGDSGAILRVVAPDPRCAITTLDPDTGRPDLDIPAAIRSYRPDPRAAFFGVYAVVERPGTVSVGDAVTGL